MIEKQLKAMLKFNVWVDAIIERQGHFFLIRDTRITSMSNWEKSKSNDDEYI